MSVPVTLPFVQYVYIGGTGDLTPPSAKTLEAWHHDRRGCQPWRTATPYRSLNHEKSWSWPRNLNHGMVVTGYAVATSCIVAKVRLARKSVSVPVTLCFVQYVYIGGCMVLEDKWVESRVDLITTYEWWYTWCRRHCNPTSGEFDLVGTNWTICGSIDKWRGVVGSWAMPGCCCYFVMLMRFVNCCGWCQVVSGS